MKTAAIYARVSATEQADNGTSLESQVAACQKYAEQNGYTVVATFKESKSGATLERPQLDQVRDLARSGAIEAVIFYALDRLSRDETDTLVLAREWRQKGIEMRCATVPLEDTPQGQFLLTMLAAVGKLERAQERVEYDKANCRRLCHTQYLLRSLIVCELCGRRLAGDRCGKKSGTQIYYACSRKLPDIDPAERCKAARLNGHRAEQKVWDWVVERLSNPDLLMELLQSNDADRAQRERDDADMRQLMGLRLELEREENKWSNAYLNDAITVDKLKEYSRSIEERRAGIDRNIEEIEARRAARTQAAHDVKTAIELCKQIQRNLPKSGQLLSFEDKRALLDALHVRVTAKPDGDVRVTATISEDLLMFTISGDDGNGDIMSHEQEAGENGQSQSIRKYML